MCSKIFLSATEPPEEGVEIGAGLGVVTGTLGFDGRVPGLNIEVLLGSGLANSGALPPRLEELKRAPLTGRVLNIINYLWIYYQQRLRSPNHRSHTQVIRKLLELLIISKK